MLIYDACNFLNLTLRTSAYQPKNCTYCFTFYLSLLFRYLCFQNYACRFPVKKSYYFGGLLWTDLTTVTEFKSDSLTRLNLLYHDFIELMDVAAIDIILT